MPPPPLGGRLHRWLRPRAPRALSGLDFVASLQNRGGIGCADYMPPPPLGARSSLRCGQGCALDPVRETSAGDEFAEHCFQGDALFGQFAQAAVGFGEGDEFGAA